MNTWLLRGPRTWQGHIRLSPLHGASAAFWRASQPSRWPTLAGAGGRTVRPASAKQEPSVQQQQQQDDRWLQACQQVTAFQQQHGRLPLARPAAQGPLLPGERPLGLWCTEQLRRKAGSKGPPLSVEERRALQDIPGWTWWAIRWVVKPWEQRQQEVEAFYQQHGRLPRKRASQSSPAVPGEQSLIYWVARQRCQFKGTAQPPLSAEHVAALESTPGWSWGEEAKPWAVRYQQLQDFVRQHGRQPKLEPGSNSRPELPGEKELGVWVDSQRRNYKAQKLSADQVAALDATPGWCWGVWSQEDWGLRLQLVQSFVYQHCRIPRQLGSKNIPFQPSCPLNCPALSLALHLKAALEGQCCKRPSAAPDGRAARSSSRDPWVVLGEVHCTTLGRPLPALAGLCAAAQPDAESTARQQQ